MVERSECSRWLNEYKNFPISLEINFHLKYIVSFDHKEQFARIDNFLVIKKFINVCDFTVQSDIRD